jgi:hypothetical protein
VASVPKEFLNIDVRPFCDYFCTFLHEGLYFLFQFSFQVKEVFVFFVVGGGGEFAFYAKTSWDFFIIFKGVITLFLFSMILDNIRVMFPRSLIKVEKASCCDMMRGCSDLSS